MSDRDELEARIRRHLELVAAAVDGAPDDRGEILDNVEAHLRAALEARGPGATRQDLEAVL